MSRKCVKIIKNLLKNEVSGLKRALSSPDYENSYFFSNNFLRRHQ